MGTIPTQTDEEGAFRKSRPSHIPVASPVFRSAVMTSVNPARTDENRRYESIVFQQESGWFNCPILQQRMMGNGPRADGDATRARIISFIENNQGSHLSAIIRALSLGNHQATIHLKTLEGQAVVWGRREAQFLRYYTSTISPYTPQEELPNPPLTFTPDMMQFRIIDRLARNPRPEARKGPLTQGILAEELGCSQQLVSHHLISLEKSGCVRSVRKGFRKEWWVLAGGLQAITGGLRSLSTVDHHDLTALIAHYQQHQ